MSFSAKITNSHYYYTTEWLFVDTQLANRLLILLFAGEPHIEFFLRNTVHASDP